MIDTPDSDTAIPVASVEKHLDDDVEDTWMRPKPYGNKWWAWKALAVVLVGTSVGLLVFFFGPGSQRGSTMNDMQAGSNGTVVATCNWSSSGAYSVSGTGELILEEGVYAWRNKDFDRSNGPNLFFYLSTDASYSGSDTVALTTHPDGGRANILGTHSFYVPSVSSPSDFTHLLLWCTLGFQFGSCGPIVMV